MRRLNRYRLGVDQGAVLMSDLNEDGPLWTGSGPREMRRAVSFAERYVAPPVVHLALTMWDIDRKGNQRADVIAEEITPEGFVVLFRTWGDTRVARVRADWLALGELPDDDDWDIR